MNFFTLFSRSIFHAHHIVFLPKDYATLTVALLRALKCPYLVIGLYVICTTTRFDHKIVSRSFPMLALSEDIIVDSEMATIVCIRGFH